MVFCALTSAALVPAITQDSAENIKTKSEDSSKPLGLASPEVLLPSSENKKSDTRAKILDEYFAKKPLAGYGALFVAAAEKNNLDWRLLPAIAIQESSGGLHRCDYNTFGWGSCKGPAFASFEAAIEAVGAHLGGNMPRTSKYYKNKTTGQILRSYNGNPGYVERVMEIMSFWPK